MTGDQVVRLFAPEGRPNLARELTPWNRAAPSLSPNAAVCGRGGRPAVPEDYGEGEAFVQRADGRSELVEDERLRPYIYGASAGATA